MFYIFDANLFSLLLLKYIKHETLDVGLPVRNIILGLRHTNTGILKKLT